MLLHGGIIHLFMNMWMQLRFGIYLERKFGTPQFVAIYVLSAFGATLLSCLLSPNSISVGASGALLGLLGANLCEILLTWNTTDPAIRKSMLTQSLIWLAMIFFISLGSSVDGAAHFGGFVTGFLVSGVLFSKSYETDDQRKPLAIAVISGAIFVIYAVVGCALFWTVVDVK
eukprot:TRINITY_DN2805_c0_g1_i1.p1 TRINITY_DN2805_c0_g1~~TRINITY_DN2805_c0_g1_i1.p1  ORF type:complete len:172 (-),score=30.80 TRINITY_DN2805_c0_g1_i1:26-541(-)